MHRFYFAGLDAAAAAIFLIPILWILNKRYFENTRRTVLYGLFALYLCGVYSVAGLPDICYIRFEPKFNFSPFAYMFSDYTSSSLNVMLFIPLGFLLPVFWKHYAKLHKTLLFGFCTSVFIEVLQIFTFRATDINDLITNTLGTLLGWIIGKLLLYFFPVIHPEERRQDVYLLCGTTFGVMFFLQPFLADLIWNLYL